MSGLWVFFAPFIRMFMTDAGKLLLMIAKDVVFAVAMDMKDAEGSDKQKVAYALIKRRLIEEGVDMTTSAINKAIEAAHARLESEQ